MTDTKVKGNVERVRARNRHIENVRGGVFDGAEIIYAYTRAQAIKDGVLVDVSQTADEAGFRFPVAVSTAVWSMIKHKDAAKQTGQLWDVLFICRTRVAALPKEKPVDRVEFEVIQIGKPKLKLWAHCGPGDDGEGVVTIMQIGED